VRLRSGAELLLEDTNDVGSDIPGIEITDPSFGRVVVDWDAFASLDFHPPGAAPVAKRAFADGARLRGTVVAHGGRSVSGFIRWDNDEEHTWDMLDGEVSGETGTVEIAIELGLVRSIERASEPSGTSRVTLRDGRAYTLAGTVALGDVGESNRGIFVTDDAGETTLVRWRELVSATFEP
jgi:hypothetical protein